MLESTSGCTSREKTRIDFPHGIMVCSTATCTSAGHGDASREAGQGNREFGANAWRGKRSIIGRWWLLENALVPPPPLDDVDHVWERQSVSLAHLG